MNGALRCILHLTARQTNTRSVRNLLHCLPRISSSRYKPVYPSFNTAGDTTAVNTDLGAIISACYLVCVQDPQVGRFQEASLGRNLLVLHRDKGAVSAKWESLGD